MTERTLELALPAQSYEAALPYLRRPYLPSQVRAKVQTTPKNPAAPCAIALYATSETLMDRFNLTCGREWEHAFEKLTEEKTTHERTTSWNCEVSAAITVFGITHTDIGEGRASTRAGAEMNARAQAYKRAGRKFGPGQCLYACDPILMWRGGDGENKLRVPSNGEERHLYPFFDDKGIGQGYVRGRYKQWLKDNGEEQFGEPLNHLHIAIALEAKPVPISRHTSNGSQPHTPSPEPTNTTPTTNEGGEDTTTEDKPAVTATTSVDPSSGTVAQTSMQCVGMPDHQAPALAIQTARNAGYDEPAARCLCNLARSDGQDARFTKPQLRIVENWLSVLNDLEITEDVLVDAAGFNAEKYTSQERRQALFTQWLARKTAGESIDENEDLNTHNNSDEQDPSHQTANTVEASAASPPEEGSGVDMDVARAIAQLQQKMGEHEYADLPVTRLAALATGLGSRAQVAWAEMQPRVLAALCELLDSAASLDWDSECLDREVLKAHQSNRQASPAGRYSAFANSVKDMAETRTLGVR